MTEQRVVIDAQIIAARVFSKEITKGTKGLDISDNLNSDLRDLRITIRDSFRGLGKFLDAPEPRGRVSNPPLRLPIFFALFAFFAAILPFGCGCAALGPSW
jgi:hypothetical protein